MYIEGKCWADSKFRLEEPCPQEVDCPGGNCQHVYGCFQCKDDDETDVGLCMCCYYDITGKVYGLDIRATV